MKIEYALPITGLIHLAGFGIWGSKFLASQARTELLKLLHGQAPRMNWTRDELLVALNLYHKLTFGQMHSRQPAIMALAEKLGRGPNSLAMKLCNFASLDPALKMRGIKDCLELARWTGRSGRSFTRIWLKLLRLARRRSANYSDADEGSEVEVTPKDGVRIRKVPAGPTEIKTTVKMRRGQEYFRQAVLNNFGGAVESVALPSRATHCLSQSTISRRSRRLAGFPHHLRNDSVVVATPTSDPFLPHNR